MGRKCSSDYVCVASLASLGLMACCGVAGGLLSGSDVDATVTKGASINVGDSCTMVATGGGTYTKSMQAGITAEIPGSTINITCNDSGGFSLYTIGNSGDTLGSTDMIGTNASIATGTSGDSSYWAMKVNPTVGNTPTIENSFDSYHVVPSTYTLVTSRESATGTEGLSVSTTYKVSTTTTQAADDYTGQVKYTLVHPYDADPPSAGPDITPPTSCSTLVPNLTYMQDLNSSNKASVLTSMTEDAQYYLADKRDNKTYCVAKLKDGNIWMTQNLDLDLDSTKTYTPTDTDISTNWTPNSSTKVASDTSWTTGDTGATIPESYDPGNLYWNGVVTYNYIDNHTSSTGSSHYLLGNYYNWTAAVAMNDSSIYTVQYQDVNQSICPAGWKLPKGGNSTSEGSFQYLITQYGYIPYEMTSPYVWNTPVKFPLSGYVYGALYGVGYSGDSWSSVVMDSDSSYRLNSLHNGDVDSDLEGGRNVGFSVRCLSR